MLDKITGFAENQARQLAIIEKKLILQKKGKTMHADFRDTFAFTLLLVCVKKQKAMAMWQTQNIRHASQSI